MAKKQTIASIEKKLLKMFPKETAFDWDKTGLLCGDKTKEITGIAVALDPTIEAVDYAKKHKCNLLLTHHPAYISAVEDFFPAKSTTVANGALIYQAISKDVALMNFHTALDVSEQGRSVLPDMLGLKKEHVLCPTDNKPADKSVYGLGQVNSLKAKDKKMTLQELSKRCQSVFGRKNRCWGHKSAVLKTIATTTGSTGSHDTNSVISNCLDANVDCLVCGEIRYHEALELSNAGVGIIELGHDVSELPLCKSLFDALLKIGVSKNDIIAIDQSKNWF